MPNAASFLKIIGFVAASAAAADPPHYTRQPTWHETMLASAQALAGADPADAFEPFVSGVMRGGDPAQRVSIALNGAKELFLFVTGIPDVKWGIGDWADAKLLGAGGSITYLDPQKNAKVLLGRAEKDLTLKSGLYQKMRLGGRVFDRGLNVQANSIVQVTLEPAHERFEAWIGVDDWPGANGTVRFSVLAARAAARQRIFQMLERDFPDGVARQEMHWEREDRIWEREFQPGDFAIAAQAYAEAAARVPALQIQARKLASAVRDARALRDVRDLYVRSRELDAAVASARTFDQEALRLAIEDLTANFPDRYPKKHLSRFAKLTASLHGVLNNFDSRELNSFEAVAKTHADLLALQREALLANPLLDFERLLVIKRKPAGDPRRSHWEGFGYGEYLGIPRQSSWNYGTMPNVNKWTNEIAALSPVRPEGAFTTFYRPSGTHLVNDIDLHWNADKLLFSMPDTNRNWQVCELRADGSGFRQLTPGAHRDVHNYDGIYVPSGDIIFLSTAPLQGVPCNAGVIVGMTYKMDAGGGNIRQLTFEQDHDYTPSVLNDGRVLYLRWDYTDTPHVWNRLLMSMNPDGTAQMEYYGANSYWPNALFFARAIPNHPTKVAAIITGHHEGRVGELFILDPAKGRHETSGVVQRIPQKGPPVQAKIEDKLTEHSWPKFLHPWPLNDKYFLVSCKPHPDALWGIYLVDVFDNMVLVKEEEGFALLEPVPFAPRPMPPVIHERTQPERNDALVYMEDVYQGPGLKNVPRGIVKALRIFTYHFGFQRLAGIDHRVGADGPWEAKRVLGTVPVEDDGSALFGVPAKVPLSFQPLDAEGKAVALMRSWMTALPGENVSCVGCHEQKSTAPASNDRRLALGRKQSEIKPWRGPVRGFSFAREVQPVLDKFCVGCHDGSQRADGTKLPDLRREQGGYVVFEHGKMDAKFAAGAKKEELLGKYSAVFEPSYALLRQYVRVGGLESDLHTLPPREFHADTSEIIQMLAKGHHNVRLDAEAWDRLVTWIDLNAPCHGTWSEVTRVPDKQCDRRLELRRLYGGVIEDAEEIPEADYVAPEPIIPKQPAAIEPPLELSGWPMSESAAQSLQASAGPATRVVDLGGGVTIELVRIPAGRFAMGDPLGAEDERPASIVTIEKPFWMAKHEISNEQFGRFNPTHDSRFEHRTSWIFDEEYLGWPLNGPKQPVVRVSWDEAMAFCHWLSGKVGEQVALPDEAQWEYACRAGTDSPLFYGALDSDFSRFGNMADANLRRLAEEGWRPKPPDLVVRESRFNDGALVTCDIGTYRPNAWGLQDMHGNAAEWTRSNYLPYPFRASGGALDGDKVVRGGSWRDRPRNCRSGFRWRYSPWQKVYNVGFRIVIEPTVKNLAAQ